MKKQLSDWVKQHSAKDYKEFYRVLNYPGYTDEEDYKLIFYISEMKHGAYSNSARCRINAIESNRNQIPFHNSTIYDAEVNINYDTGVAILTDNVVDEKSRGKGIGSLGMTYSELPVSKEAGFLRNQSKDTGFEPAGSLFSCLSG